MKVLLIYRDQRLGNFSIEHLYACIGAELRVLGVEVFEYVYDKKIDYLSNIRLIRKYEPDVYHITGDVNFLVFGLPRSKTIITVHDLGHYEQTLKGIKKWVYKWLWLQWPLLYCRSIVSISTFTANKIGQYLSISSAKITVIHNPIAKVFRYSPKEPASVPVILQIGSGRNKNIEKLMEAIEDLPCSLLLIRRPNEALEAILMAKGIRYDWRTDLNESELVNAYQEADILYFASTYEGFGMPIIEAQAVGRPVVTSTIAAMPEVAGRGALLVNPFDAIDVRKAIQRLIADVELRNSLVASGFENVKRFDIKHIASMYCTLYNNLLTK
jgi:glycosyltransferase involved in cell wall biosynthesis